MAIRGAIFDLDGTLVDSALDFDQMRREMGLPPDLPLLEAIEKLSDAQATRCWKILEHHELSGSRRATLFPGVREFLFALETRGIRRAVFTRNCRTHTAATLDRLQLVFDPVVCREDGPVKPHPSAIWNICKTWGLNPSQSIVIGDHRFDIEAGRAAGCATVLFTGGSQLSGLADGETADHVLTSFAAPAAFWDWLQIDLEGSEGSC